MADPKASNPYRSSPEANLVIRDFGGMRPTGDPHDIAPGQSVHQVNCGVGPEGELRVRLGARVVHFS